MEEAIRVGVDMAVRDSDATVIAILLPGAKRAILRKMRGASVAEVRDALLEMARGERRRLVFTVDGTGVGGSLTDALRLAGLEVREVVGVTYAEALIHHGAAAADGR